MSRNETVTPAPQAEDIEAHQKPFQWAPCGHVAICSCRRCRELLETTGDGQRSQIEGLLEERKAYEGDVSDRLREAAEQKVASKIKRAEDKRLRMKKRYDFRIKELEQRLHAAERSGKSLREVFGLAKEGLASSDGRMAIAIARIDLLDEDLS